MIGIRLHGKWPPAISHKKKPTGILNGYYFSVSGKHRTFETVSFYVALSAAGLPVFLYDADAILARIEGSDYIGIVPHHIIPKYCESMFPEKYGKVVDFMHVYDEDIAELGAAIEWLPMEQAELKVK